MDKITVTVTNWEKYNPRKDIKHPTWFALSNRFLEDPEFFEFTPLELKACLYVFCQASQKNSPEVTIIPSHAKRVCDIDRVVLDRALQKLAEIGAVRLDTDPRTQPERARTESVRDRQTDKQTSTPVRVRTAEESATPSGFDEAFSRYPVQIKGPHAEQRYRDQIKTPKDHEDLLSALENYTAMLAMPENSWRKPKQNFATFLGTRRSGAFWRDFVTWSPPRLQPTAGSPDIVER